MRLHSNHLCHQSPQNPNSELDQHLDQGELARLKKMSEIEKKLYLKGYNVIAGVDEAGRGPLAGPVIAAACILPRGFLLKHLNDSKKLTPTKRDLLYQVLISSPDIYYGIGIVEAQMIDRINVLQATFLAMQQALAELSIQPEIALVDGHLLPKLNMKTIGIVKGDSLSLSIAAASVIAKKTRDDLMKKYHLKWPEYGFNAHKGYGTKKHLEALCQLGPSPIHRLSFAPLKPPLKAL